MPDCQECNTSVSVETCADINYLETLCDPAFIQPIKCTYWSGAPITCLGITTSDTGEEVITKIATALCAINDPVNWANYVKISSGDTTGGYLQTKLLAGTNITITKQNTGGNETLTVNASYTETPVSLTNTDNTLLITPDSGNNHNVLLGINLSTNAGNAISKTSTGLYVPNQSFKVKTTIDDTTEEYLLAKLIAGSNITLTKTVTSGVERISIAASASSGLGSVSVQSTDSIILAGNGTSGTPITATLQLSSNINNIASFDGTDGSLLVLQTDRYAKISAQDTTASYLENKIVAGTGITLTKLNPSSNESLSISLATSYNGFIKNQTTSQSSSNFYITGLGRMGSLRSDGDTFLSPTTTVGPYSLLLNNTSTGRVEKIAPEDFVSNYVTSYTLPIATTSVLGGVKVDGTTITISGGVISSAGSGYTLPTATSSVLGGIKIGAGLTITSDVVSVNAINLTSGVTAVLPIANGGTGSSTQNWVDLTTDQNNINGVKTFIGNSLKVTNLLQVNSTDTTSSISAINTTLNNSISGVTTRVIDNTGLIYNGVYGEMYITNTSTFTHTALRNITGTSGIVYFNNTGNITLYSDPRTAYSGLNGTVYGGNSGNVTGDFINGISSNAYFSSTGNYTNVTGIKLSNPSLVPTGGSYTGTITNYYGIYIPDISTSNIVSNITNKYGIYQAGTTAQNYFGGVSTFASGGFDSDMRLKTLIEIAPIVKNIGTLKSKSYKKDGQFHIGYFAQEVKEVIPSAIITKADGFLSVAYHEVHTAKIEYLENKIQELENLLKSK